MCLNFVKSIHRRATGLWCNFGLERASERPNKTPFSPPQEAWPPFSEAVSGHLGSIGTLHAAEKSTKGKAETESD